MRLLAAAALLIQPTATLNTVGIVGAGPAGLTLAVALNRALPDVAVTIFDRSDSCRPALGGGVQLNSGAAVLARLDPALGAAVAALGQPVRRVRSRTAGGDGLLDLDLAARPLDLAPRDQGHPWTPPGPTWLLWNCTVWPLDLGDQHQRCTLDLDPGPAPGINPKEDQCPSSTTPAPGSSGLWTTGSDLDLATGPSPALTF